MGKVVIDGLYLLSTAENTQFPETNVEWRRHEPIFLLDDDDIDGTGQCGSVDSIVVSFEVVEHFANQLHFRCSLRKGTRNTVAFTRISLPLNEMLKRQCDG